MNHHSVPPGWGHNPSRWRDRLPVLTLALAGCGIATYLGLFQVGIVPQVWEPFFGNGSRLLLKDSPVAHMLPIPDALLGAVVYFFEAVAECLGGPDRWRSAPWAVLLLGLIAGGLGVAAVVLILCQAFVFHAYCTLCLASAACSLLAAGAAASEVLAGLGQVRHALHQGASLREALAGPGSRQGAVGQA